VKLVTDHTIHGTAEAAEKAPGAAHDCFEHRLLVDRRVSDHPQNLARRTFTCQSLIQGTVHIRMGRQSLRSVGGTR
jgi:hypothetical protein